MDRRAIDWVVVPASSRRRRGASTPANSVPTAQRFSPAFPEGDLDVLRRGSPWGLQRQPHRRPRPLHATGLSALCIVPTGGAAEAVGRSFTKMIAGSWQDSYEFRK